MKLRRWLRSLDEVGQDLIIRFNARAADLERRSKEGEFGKWPWQEDYRLWPWQRRRKSDDES